MARGTWVVVGTAGLAAMVVASAWAPLQPELITTGGACQLAPCGMLEDPDRWRRAWLLWWVGASLAALAAVFVLAPRQPGPRDVLRLVVSAVLVVLPLALVALVLSVVTSVHGVATAASLVPLAGLALLGSWVRGWATARLSSTGWQPPPKSLGRRPAR